MGAFIDITGQRYGRLVALEPAEPDANRRTKWLVRCDCGVEKLVDSAHMRYGRIRSCGCLQDELAKARAPKVLVRYAGINNRRHGMSGTPVYAVWGAMIERCRNLGAFERAQTAYRAARGEPLPNLPTEGEQDAPAHEQ